MISSFSAQSCGSGSSIGAPHFQKPGRHPGAEFGRGAGASVFVLGLDVGTVGISKRPHQ